MNNYSGLPLRQNGMLFSRVTIAQAMIDARKESGLTQKQLSERTGIQADISKLNGETQTLLCAPCSALRLVWG